jgi:HipA-like protein
MIRKRWKFGYKEPPPTLVVLYQDQPIAELEQAPLGYLFRYLPAFEGMKLSPFPGLPLEKGDRFYYDLPTYFEERLPDMKRPEIREWMEQHEISADSKLQLLAQLGTHTITDPFEFRLKVAA